MTILTEEKKITYKIEQRIYKDVHWFGGWFFGIKPEWDNWKLYGTYETIEKTHNTLKILEAKKPFAKFKTEYRIIKNEK